MISGRVVEFRLAGVTEERMVEVIPAVGDRFAELLEWVVKAVAYDEHGRATVHLDHLVEPLPVDNA